jgi:polyisoprenoid-binding protein YceI
MINRTFAAFAATVAMFLAGNAAQAQRYTIDPTHTSIVFSVAHSGLSFTYGMFLKASGSYVIDKQNPANCQFQLIIKADSLFTNDLKRDQHLQSPDFFDVKQFPEITFVSTKCSRTDVAEGVAYQVTGNLTMHGQTRPVTFLLRMLGEGAGAFGDQRTGFLCQIESLKRTDYGIGVNLAQPNMVGDAVGITISFEGVQQAAGTAR